MNELMQKSNHLPPNRQINLNTIWIGRWYPFADDNGYVDDPKTIVHLAARGAKFLPPDQDAPAPLLDVKVDDLVCVRSARFRPRYDEDSLFVVVYKGSKYVDRKSVV
jgi:hypothetical protein